MAKKYIYLGENLDLPDFRLSKGDVYHGDKIEEIRAKYPILSKILICTEELATLRVEDNILEALTEQLKNELGGVK